MGARFRPEDIINKIKSGKLPAQNIDLFTSGAKAHQIPGLLTPRDGFDQEGFRLFELFIPGMEVNSITQNPIPKQSFRMAPNRHFKDGEHYCPRAGKTIPHKKGDVMTFVNKKTNLIDVIFNKYTDKKVVQWEKHVADHITSQLPLDFTKFKEFIHITRLWFLFKPLTSFKKAEIEAIEQGKLIEKNTKPDLPDNLPKSIMDALEGVMMENDSIISRINDMGKFYAKQQGVILHIKGK